MARDHLGIRLVGEGTRILLGFPYSVRPFRPSISLPTANSRKDHGGPGRDRLVPLSCSFLAVLGK